jgi:hypothetical protein
MNLVRIRHAAVTDPYSTAFYRSEILAKHHCRVFRMMGRILTVSPRMTTETNVNVGLIDKAVAEFATIAGRTAA